VEEKVVECILKKLDTLAGHQPYVDLAFSNLQKRDNADRAVELQ
jgi:hypothetical protein